MRHPWRSRRTPDSLNEDSGEGQRLLEAYPRLPQLARENRLFLARAVAWPAGQGMLVRHAGHHPSDA